MLAIWVIYIIVAHIEFSLNFHIDQLVGPVFVELPKFQKSKKSKNDIFFFACKANGDVCVMGFCSTFSVYQENLRMDDWLLLVHEI